MTTRLNPYLGFGDNARQAIEFYRSVFGGELTLVSYGDAGVPDVPAEQIMWGQVQGDEGFHLMAYDVPANLPWDQGVNSFFVSVRGKSAEEITTYWKGLAEGATVVQDLGPAGWAPLYGMLKDRFGVVWVLDVSAY